MAPAARRNRGRRPWARRAGSEAGAPLGPFFNFTWAGGGLSACLFLGLWQIPGGFRAGGVARRWRRWPVFPAPRPEGFAAPQPRSDRPTAAALAPLVCPACGAETGWQRLSNYAAKRRTPYDSLGISLEHQIVFLNTIWTQKTLNHNITKAFLTYFKQHFTLQEFLNHLGSFFPLKQHRLNLCLFFSLPGEREEFPKNARSY